MAPSPIDTAMSSRQQTEAGASPFSKTSALPRSRAPSVSSDRPSTITHSLMSAPLSVSPEAAFIAASAASQIVTNDHDSHADTWYDQQGIEPSGEAAVVSPGALTLVNSFLDQLLFNFLSAARSTTLSALRPAVSEVLKPKLARDAINQAEEELREYLGGGDDEQMTQVQSPVSPKDWDLELVWKRTRLRCMVYSSLGDMEEEDEDYHMEQEHLDGDIAEVVSPAVAIFLTSILEFMGEQALIIAGQASFHRVRSKHEKDLRDGAPSPALDIAERIVVEELDMERVALDRTLGRLWRAWKKKVRSPLGGNSMDMTLRRQFSRDSVSAMSPTGMSHHLRQSSLSVESAVPPTVPEPVEEQAPVEEMTPVSEEALAASIPLPMGPKDVDEIEVPGLASYSDEEDSDDDLEIVEVGTARPKSLMIFAHPIAADLPTPTMSQPQTPTIASRKRSNSLPTPAASPYNSPAKRAKMQPVAAKPTDATDQEATPESAEAAPEEVTEVKEDLPSEEAPKAREAVAEPQAVHDDDEPPAEVPARSEKRKSMGPMAAFTAGAAAIGLAISTGVESVAKAAAVQPEPEATDIEDEGEEDEEPEEEVQILTSSRISISGRSSSPSSTEAERHPAAAPVVLPIRTPSLRSARLIDVTGPRSPVTRSRNSSVDASEHFRSGSLSRTNSITTPIIIEERRSPLEPSPVMRAVSTMPGSKLRPGAADSISEAEELPDEGVSPIVPAERFATAVTSATARVPSPKPRSPLEQMEAELHASSPIFGSSSRANASPREPDSPKSPSAPPSPQKAVTKVTILKPTSSAQNQGTFFIDEQRPELPQKKPAPARVQVSVPAPPPTVPERSPSRQALNQPASAPQPSSIGMVSVEQPRTRSPSETSVTRSPDRSVPTRQLHTSGSSSTSSTGKPKPIRSSDESARKNPVDVARNFEELIQSDQTIQYTLTPENMRDMDTQSTRSGQNSGSPITVKARKSEDRHASAASIVGGDRARSSSTAKPNEMKRAASVSKSTGLNSHPFSDELIVANGNRPTVPRANLAMPNTSRPRANAPQARDARLPRESVADLARFLRDTGPQGEAQVTPLVTTAAAASSGAARSASGQGHVSRPSNSTSTGEPSRVSTSSSNTNRIRLQARDAHVDYKDDNSDLIDFIRRGPPSTNGNPRIPRTVAPFRSTMDSDQMSGAVGGKAVDANIRELRDSTGGAADVRSSQASTSITDYSMASSMNSSTALLNNRNKALPAQFGGMDDDMPIPKRKTRRVRDPYAIDVSDEEEEEDGEDDGMPAAAPAAGASRRKIAPVKEESLAEFLRNVPPPPEPTVQPLAITQAQNRPKRKASAPSLMARLTRRDTNSSSHGPASPKLGGGASGQRGPVVDSRSLNSRAGGGRGYIPIQVNIPSSGLGSDPYGSNVAPSFNRSASASVGAGNNFVGSSKAAAMMGGGPVGGSGRVQMKKFEPRDASSVPAGRGATSDLADFLRNSEPPAGMGGGSPVMPIVQQEESGGFSKVFGRRKKSSVY